MTHAQRELGSELLSLARQLSQQPSAAHAGRLLAAEIQHHIRADQVSCVMPGDGSRVPDAGGVQASRSLKCITEKSLCVDIIGFDGRPVVVVLASRMGATEAFSEDDAVTMRLFAAVAGPALAALLMTESRRDTADDDDDEADERGLYLPGAWEHHQSEGDALGTLMPVLPPPVRFSHWLIIGFVIAAVAYSITARVDLTIEGPSIIRAVQKVSLTAPSAGVVQTVDVVAGQRVELGELIASLYGSAGQSPSDRVNADIRAAAGGVISDLRLRVGQRVMGGDIVGSVTHPEAGFEVISFVPGANAPRLSRGMAVTVRLANYPETAERLRVDHVGLDVVGQSEALKFAGPEGSSLAISGPVVIVRSTVTAPTFESDGRTYRYHDGLAATSLLRVGSEPLLFNLFPSLKAGHP